MPKGTEGAPGGAAWSRRDRLAVGAAVFALALAVRLLHVWFLRDAPWFGLKMGDAAAFHDWALRIAGGDWLGSEVFLHAPLYPYFLGVVYTVFGSDPLTARLVQAVVGALSCVFTAMAAGRLFGRRAAAVAGGLLALYAPAIFFDGIFQDSVLDLFLASLTLWTLAELFASRRRWLWAALGLVLGLFTLSRENAAILAVPVLLWLALEGEGGPRRRAGAAALLVVGGLAALAPVAVRNYAVGGQLIPGSYNFGMNLYIGNHPGADGYYHPLRPGRGNPRYEAEDVVALAERATGRDLSPSEVSAYWAGRALAYVTSQPLDWARLLGRKALLTLNDTEANDTLDLYTFAERSPPLRLLHRVLGFGVLLPLALLGVWLTWPERGRLWPFYVLPAVYLGALVLFVVFARYRHPAAPFLALLGAAGLVRLPRFVREASTRRRLACGAAVVALGVVCHLPIGVSPEQLRATTHANVGAALEEQGRLRAAARQYARGLEIDPANSQASYHLAALLHRTGRVRDALPHYRRAIRSDPDRPQIRNNYGVALAMLGRVEEAREQLRRAAELDPIGADAYTNLGRTYSSAGDLETALAYFRKALEADSAHRPARLRLGRGLLLDGQVEEGYAQLRRVAAAGRAGAAGRTALAAAWELAAGRAPGDRAPDLALEILGEAPAFVPRGVGYHRALAAARAGDGDFAGAVAAARSALDALGAAGRAGRERGAAGGPGAVGQEQLRAELERYRAGEEPPPGR